MSDITDRLTYANVLTRPLVLVEAVEVIQHLRADLERERRWIRNLEDCIMDGIRKHDRKIEQGQGREGREGIRGDSVAGIGTGS